MDFAADVNALKREFHKNRICKYYDYTKVRKDENGQETRVKATQPQRYFWGSVASTRECLV